jgi:hypothetical protein
LKLKIRQPDLDLNNFQPREMAKSIRSKIKRKFRAIKREQVFGPAEQRRLERLAHNQSKHLGELEQQAQHMAEDQQTMICTIIEESGLAPMEANNNSNNDDDNKQLSCESATLSRPGPKPMTRRGKRRFAGKAQPQGNRRRKAKTSTTFF